MPATIVFRHDDGLIYYCREDRFRKYPEPVAGLSPKQGMVRCDREFPGWMRRMLALVECAGRALAATALSNHQPTPATRRLTQKRCRAYGAGTPAFAINAGGRGYK